MATRERFDVIISDLFVPWHAGTGSLYSREHFEICRSRLNEGGHFVLWVPVLQLSRAEFDIIAHTLLTVFPHVTAWRGEFVPRFPTMALICSTEKRELDPARVRQNLAHVVVDRAPERITDADILPWVNYAGNLGACRHLFADAAINTDDRPVIEYGAPKTQQRAESGVTPWLTSYELLRLLDELITEVPPEDDPFLARLEPEQIAYVRAGYLLYTVGVHVAAERFAEAAPLYREFLSTIPFDIFPGLASR
jgi:spermidine synthase